MGTYLEIKHQSKDGGTMGTLKTRADGIVWENQVPVSLSRFWTEQHVWTLTACVFGRLAIER